MTCWRDIWEVRTQNCGRKFVSLVFINIKKQLDLKFKLFKNLIWGSFRRVSQEVAVLNYVNILVS